jgi:hypothetical protein
VGPPLFHRLGYLNGLASLGTTSTSQNHKKRILKKWQKRDFEKMAKKGFRKKKAKKGFRKKKAKKGFLLKGTKSKNRLD